MADRNVGMSAHDTEECRRSAQGAGYSVDSIDLMFTTIPSDMMKQTILLVSSLAVAYAADFSPGSNFGMSNDTALINANQHPNISRSVPFQMGNQNFTFRVNIAEFVPDWNATVQNPRVATSFYAIE
ncbi:hypothetical protein E4T44_06103 [Aureobasidium sp. EXF-8845]|nr:hypothetical protein E4T44_06103 [Aureobasidium sp. EXF-8845]KAI4849420.1 hypothetical protein E4T45_05916 [Aureobasidium sp. EXF-8846]